MLPEPPGCNVRKLFSSPLPLQATKLECFTARLFGLAKRLTLWWPLAKRLALHANNGVEWKVLLGTNTLAYLALGSVRKEKSFLLSLTPECSTTKPRRSVSLRWASDSNPERMRGWTEESSDPSGTFWIRFRTDSIRRSGGPSRRRTGCRCCQTCLKLKMSGRCYKAFYKCSQKGDTARQLVKSWRVHTEKYFMPVVFSF